MNTSSMQKMAAWSVHILTGFAAIAGIFALQAIVKQQYILAFWLMAIAVFIDAIDGTLARRTHLKSRIPNIDGALIGGAALKASSFRDIIKNIEEVTP